MKFEKSNRTQIRTLRGWVKFNLSLKGLILSDLAKKHHCDLPIVFFRPFPRAERIIADALETQPWELWPDRYDSTGRPNRKNTWYLRKSGGWKPKAKNIIDEVKVKENLDEQKINRE